MNRFGLMALVVLVFALTGGVSVAAPTLTLRSSPLPPWQSEGHVIWIKIAAGRMKTRVYTSSQLGAHPVLAVFIHGDLPPRQSMYHIAQVIAHETRNVVAVGVLRPGYTDAEGDMSSGHMGYAVGDNYTPDVVDAVDAAIRELKARYHAGAVVLIGHSGGGAITADVLGRHPQDVDAALLLACGCDPKEFMVRWTKDHPAFPKNLPNPSLLPLDLAVRVSPRVHVRMVVGSQDDVVRIPASEAYARALEARGVDVKLVVVPGAGHNDVPGTPQALGAMTEVLTMEGAEVVQPSTPDSSTVAH
jgi:pimeloyl-ACP methyl ester carboxylesterase